MLWRDRRSVELGEIGVGTLLGSVTYRWQTCGNRPWPIWGTNLLLQPQTTRMADKPPVALGELLKLDHDTTQAPTKDDCTILGFGRLGSGWQQQQQTFAGKPRAQRRRYNVFVFGVAMIGLGEAFLAVERKPSARKVHWKPETSRPSHATSVYAGPRGRHHLLFTFRAIVHYFAVIQKLPMLLVSIWCASLLPLRSYSEPLY